MRRAILLLALVPLTRSQLRHLRNSVALYERALRVTTGNFMAHVAAVLPNHIAMEVVAAGRTKAMSVDNHIQDGWIVLGCAVAIVLSRFIRRSLEPTRSLPQVIKK